MLSILLWSLPAAGLPSLLLELAAGSSLADAAVVAALFVLVLAAAVPRLGLRTGAFLAATSALIFLLSSSISVPIVSILIVPVGPSAALLVGLSVLPSASFTAVLQLSLPLDVGLEPAFVASLTLPALLALLALLISVGLLPTAALLAHVFHFAASTLAVLAPLRVALLAARLALSLAVLLPSLGLTALFVLGLLSSPFASSALPSLPSLLSRLLPGPSGTLVVSGFAAVPEVRLLPCVRTEVLALASLTVLGSALSLRSVPSLTAAALAAIPLVAALPAAHLPLLFPAAATTAAGSAGGHLVLPFLGSSRSRRPLRTVLPVVFFSLVPVTGPSIAVFVAFRPPLVVASSSAVSATLVSRAGAALAISIALVAALAISIALVAALAVPFGTTLALVAVVVVVAHGLKMWGSECR